jgi:hypothetical protein
LLAPATNLKDLRGRTSTKSKSKNTLPIYDLSLQKYPSDPLLHQYLMKYNLEVSHLLLGILLKEAMGAQ